MDRSPGRRAVRPAPVAAALVVLLALVPAPAGAEGVRETFPSILIEGDAAFALPTSGVRAGSGTPEDPYVISGWNILQTERYALKLLGTRAHVMIEDVQTEDLRDVATGRTLCQPLWLCTEGAAIVLDDAQNVTIRRVEVRADAFGVAVLRSKDVLLHDVRVGEITQPSSQVGVGVASSEDVVVSGLRTRNTAIPFAMYEAARVLLQDADLWGGVSQIGDGRDLTIAGAHVRDGSFDIWGDVANLSLEQSEFTRGGFRADWGNTDAVLVCGSRFTNATGLSALLLRGHGVRVAGNEFHGNAKAIEVQLSREVSVEGNIVAASTARGLLLGYHGGLVRANAFEGNAGDHVIVGPTDASGNWWGSADGPNSTGADRVWAVHGVAVDPWLDAAPAVERSCAGERRPSLPPAHAIVAEHHAVGRGVAARVLIDAPEGVAVSFSASLRGPIPQQAYGYQFIHGNGVSWGGWGTFYGESTTTQGSAGPMRIARLPVEEGELGAELAFECHGIFCPREVIIVMGGGEGSRGALFVGATDPSARVTILPGEAQLVTLVDLEGGALARSSVVGLGAGVAAGSKAIEVSGELHGFSRLTGFGAADWSVATPDGREGAGATFVAWPAGSYEVQVRHAVGIVGPPTLWALFGDVPSAT